MHGISCFHGHWNLEKIIPHNKNQVCDLTQISNKICNIN